MQEIKKYLPRPLRYFLKYIEGKCLHQLKVSKKTIFDIYAFIKWMVVTPKLDATWFDIVEQFIKTFGLCVVNNFSYGLVRLIRKPEKIEQVKPQLWHLLGLVECLLKNIDTRCKLKDFQLKTLETLKQESKFQYNVFKRLEKMEVIIDDKHLFLYTFIISARRWAGKCMAKLRTGVFNLENFTQEQQELNCLLEQERYIEESIIQPMNDLDKKFYGQLINFYARVKFEFIDLDIAKFSEDEINQDDIVLEVSTEEPAQNEVLQGKKQTEQSELEPGQVIQSEQQQNLNQDSKGWKILDDDSETKSNPNSSNQTQDLEEGQLSPPCAMIQIKQVSEKKNEVSKLSNVQALRQKILAKKLVKLDSSSQSSEDPEESKKLHLKHQILEEKHEVSSKKELSITKKPINGPYAGNICIKIDNNKIAQRRTLTLNEQIKRCKEIAAMRLNKKPLTLKPIKEESIKLEDDNQDSKLLSVKTTQESFGHVLRAKKIQKEQEKAQIHIMAANAIRNQGKLHQKQREQQPGILKTPHAK